jgi:hypothetical protein
MQSKLGSLIESVTNTAIGFSVTWLCSPFIYSFCDIKYNYTQLTQVTILFTLVSVARSYVIRRFFNKKKI